MGKYYWLSSGLLFAGFGLCAVLLWDMLFAAWFWGMIGGGKLAIYLMAEVEERKFR